jgi:hypothetical protein
MYLCFLLKIKNTMADHEVSQILKNPAMLLIQLILQQTEKDPN